MPILCTQWTETNWQAESEQQIIDIYITLFPVLLVSSFVVIYIEHFVLILRSDKNMIKSTAHDSQPVGRGPLVGRRGIASQWGPK